MHASGLRADRRRSPIDEITLPGSRGVLVLAPGVSRGGKIHHAARGHRIDRLRDDLVLERGFVEVGDVVDDHAAAGGLQGEDVARETRRARETRGEINLRTGSKILDNFHHRRAFVARTRLT